MQSSNDARNSSNSNTNIIESLIANYTARDDPLPSFKEFKQVVENCFANKSSSGTAAALLQPIGSLLMGTRCHAGDLDLLLLVNSSAQDDKVSLLDQVTVLSTLSDKIKNHEHVKHFRVSC